MSYQIKDEYASGDGWITLVEYTFADNSKSEIAVYHVDGTNRAAVIKGIENREVSEQRALVLAACFQEWVSGTGLLKDFRSFPMKLRVVGNVVETSYGNSVPLADAISLYNAWKAREAEVGQKVGDFEVKNSSLNRMLIDCSPLTLAEADRVIGPLANQ